MVKQKNRTKRCGEERRRNVSHDFKNQAS